MPKLIKNIFISLFVILLSAAGIESTSLAALPKNGVMTPSRDGDARLSRQRAERLNGVVEILESRIKNHQLPEKAKNKLVAMNDEEIRLVASLCDRMAGEGNTAGADLALMLVTAMIVLS